MIKVMKKFVQIRSLPETSSSGNNFVVIFKESCGKATKHLGNGKIKFWMAVETGRVEYHYEVNRFSSMHSRHYLNQYMYLVHEPFKKCKNFVKGLRYFNNLRRKIILPGIFINLFLIHNFQVKEGLVLNFQINKN